MHDMMVPMKPKEAKTPTTPEELDSLSTCGKVEDHGVSVTFGGMCPVQGYGTIDGHECYYRSRGSGWQFHVAATSSAAVFSDDAWVHEEDPYTWPDGGYVTADISKQCIREAVEKFRADMKWEDFEVTPIENAEAHEAALEIVKKMTPQEVLDSSVKVGIHNPDGSLTKEYGGK